MKHLFKILAIILLLPIFHANAQTDTEFWFCIPQVTWQHEGDIPSLLITTTDLPAKVTIEMPMESRFTTVVLDIPKNTSYKHEFSDYMQCSSQGVKKGTHQEDNILESGLYGESCVVKNKGIHITSTALITAYLERGWHDNGHNDDIWALKGQNAFGTYFIVPSQNTFDNHKFSGASSVEDPGDWNAIDIVAVEDCEVTVKLREAGLVNNFGSGQERTFVLKRGQTLNLQAASQSANKHLNGTIIESDGLIAVQWKDDSVHKKNPSNIYSKSECGSYDLIGDQLVRTELSGKEYIVMRGQLGENSKVKGEFVYLMSTVDETTTITAKAIDEDGNVKNLTVSSLSGIGDMTRILLNPRFVDDDSKKNYDVVHIKASKPIVVMHIAGFGGEMGGAILPRIEGCTGSTDVSVCRSTDEGFFLNIMCKSAHKSDFTITIKDKNGTIIVAGEKYRYYNKAIPSDWFTDIPGTEWCYLNKAHVEFHKDGDHTFIVKKNDVVKVSNSTGLFHLAIINGGVSTGCRYGYFSDFSSNMGEAVISNEDYDSDYSKFCEGDVVTLVAKGGLKVGGYHWNYVKETPSGDKILTEETFIDQAQTALDTPKVQPYKGWNQYKVRITRRCYLRIDPITMDNIVVAPQDTIINVWALGYPRAKSDFSIETITDCSPAKVVFTNKTIESGNMLDYTWTLDGGNLTTPYKSTKRNYGADTLTFTNTTDAKHTYNLTLEASIGSNCPDKSDPKSFCVNPVITASISADPVKGCTPLAVKFENNSTGPYTKILVNFGDGTGWIDSYTPQTRTMNHTYNNPSIYDTVYWAKIKIFDEVNGSCESEDSVKIRVFGRVKSQYIIDNTSDCSPLTTKIENTSLGDEQNIVYSWNFDVVPSGSVNKELTDGRLEYLWNGDMTAGNVRNDRPFNITYRNTANIPARHLIRLTATRQNSDGSTCASVTPWDTVTVFPEFTVDYEVSPKYICDSSYVSFNNKSSDLSDNSHFYWYMGDGATENSHGQFYHTYYHTLPEVQEYETKLIGESKYGCRDTASNGTITVMPYLNPNFTIDKAEGCSPLYVTVVNNTPGHSYKENPKWVIDCAPCTYEIISGSLDDKAVIKFENTTGSRKEITISLTESYRDVNMTYDCPKTFSRSITIFPEITAAIASDKTAPVCDGTTVTFTNSTIFTGVTTSPADYRWTFGDGAALNKTDNSATTHIYNNTTGSTGTSPVSFTATLIAMAYGCSDTATATVEVYPPVVASFTSDNYSVCAPATVTLNNSSTGAGKFVYTFADGTPDSVKIDMTAVTYNIVNTDPNQIAVRPVTLTASNGECTDVITKNFYAYPVIVPQFTLSKTEGCAPVEGVVLDRSATTGASIYKVDFGDGITDETGRAQLTHTFENKTGADASYVVKLTAANIIGCSASTEQTVTVFPELAAAFSFEKATECSPSDVTMKNNSLNGSQFVWSFGDGTASETKTDKADFTHNYVNSSADGNSISDYTIKLVTIDANHPVCRDSVTRTIQIYPQVIAQFATENAEGCSPLTTTFVNQSKGYGLTYSWDYDHDNRHSAETAASHTHSFDNIEAEAHTYNVKLTVTDINNCQSVTTMPVKAYPHVTADFAYVKSQTCTPYPVTFSYPTSALNGNRFDWDFGFGGNTAIKTDRQTFDFVFDNDALDEVKTYTITLVTTDTTTGCSDRTSKPIEVYPQLKPAFTQDITEGCNPLPVAFTNQTTGLADYLWEFGDSQSSSEVNPKHLFKHHELTDQNYNVVLKTTQTATGCEKKVNQNITVYSYVLAKFGINETEDGANGAANGILGGCTPFDVTITDSSRLISTGTWSWDFGDGTTSVERQPKSRVYTNDDKDYPLENKNYTIKLVVTNDHGCRHDTAQVIAVYPRSVPDFTGNFAGCEPLTVAFEDKSVVDDKTQYFWTFSDGSTIVERPPFSKTFHNYDYENSKKYTVNLKTTTEYNCSDEITKEIEVYAKPLARFIPLADRACPPFEAEFKNTSIGVGLNFNWNFGNGEVRDTTGLGNQKVVYNNTTSEPVTYNVVLMTESEHGCRDTMINPMITFPDVVVDFDYNPAGCSPHTVNFVNKSSKTVTNHLWYFGEGSASVADAPSFTYFNTTDNDQVLTVTYIGSSKYQCTDTIKKNVTVYINPNVDFVAHEPSQRYPDDTVYFENYTQDGPWTYSWDFGDGKTSNTGEKYFMHKYGKWAPNSSDNIFHVTLSVKSEHCKNTVSHDVTILPPYPRIRITNEKPAGCVPLTVQFEIEAEYCKTYEWTFDDGTTSTDPTPEHTFTEPGIYNVKLTAYGDGGSHYDYEIITVHELPQPDFTTSPQFVMLPNQQVQFFNATRNGYNYVWDFGDGTYSSEQNPHHLYTEEGIYDVKLVAYSTQMCVDSILKIAEVEVSGAGYIKYPNAFMPSDMSPSDGSYPVPDDMNNVFHPKWSGVKEYDLWIFNRWGEMLFHTTNIEEGWNGKYNNDGKELGQDVYFWKAKGKFQNNTPFKIAGDVTLIRK